MFTLHFLAASGAYDTGYALGRMFGLVLLVALPLLAIFSLILAVRKPSVVRFLFAGITGLAALGLGVVFVVSAVKGYQQGVARVKGSDETKVALGQGRAFEIEIPEDWEENLASMGGAPALLKAGNQFRGEFMAVEAAPPSIKNLPFATFKNVMFGAIAAAMQNVKTGPQVPCKVGSLNGETLEITGTDPKTSPLPMTFQITCVEGKGNYYYIVQWTQASHAERSKERFAKVVASFEELPGAGDVMPAAMQHGTAPAPTIQRGAMPLPAGVTPR